MRNLNRSRGAAAKRSGSAPYTSDFSSGVGGSRDAHPADVIESVFRFHGVLHLECVEHRCFGIFLRLWFVEEKQEKYQSSDARRTPNRGGGTFSWRDGQRRWPVAP